MEQVFSLDSIDYYFLREVSNSTFTEAFAMIFQSRNMEILALGAEPAETRALMALDTEMKRIYRLGMLTPMQWISQAVGTEISVKPLIEATARAVKVIGI